MRIRVHYGDSALDELTSAQAAFLRDELMPAVERRWAELLEIARADGGGNLTLARPCATYWPDADGCVASCASVAADEYCGSEDDDAYNSRVPDHFSVSAEGLHAFAALLRHEDVPAARGHAPRPAEAPRFGAIAAEGGEVLARRAEGVHACAPQVDNEQAALVEGDAVAAEATAPNGVVASTSIARSSGLPAGRSDVVRIVSCMMLNPAS